MAFSLCLSSDFTYTVRYHPVRSISASAWASALSDFTRRLLTASAAARASMHTTGNPALASSRASQGVIDPLSRPIFASFPPQRCKALHNTSGCVSTTPGHTTALRLKPTSSPANILIAALLPSLEESPAERGRLPAGEQQPHVWDVLRIEPDVLCTIVAATSEDGRTTICAFSKRRTR